MIDFITIGLHNIKVANTQIFVEACFLIKKYAAI